MKFAGVEVQPLTTRNELLNMLIWGAPACGKTVLAATAPGKKLWLQFDPGGVASLDSSEDIIVADMTGLPIANYGSFSEGGVYEKDLINVIRESGCDTVVVDSLTSFAHNAMVYVVQSGKASGNNFKATVEQPGEAGYGIRNGFVFAFFNMIQRACANQGKHCIVILHEKDKYGRKDGSGQPPLLGVVPSLGGQNESNIPLKVSEVWRMSDDGKRRYVYVRNHGTFFPMRTRMFLMPVMQTRFVADYNQETQQGVTINGLYETWKAAGFNKIPPPNKGDQ